MARTFAGSAKPRRKERPAKALADRDKRLYRIGALAVAVALAVLWEVASRVSKGEVKPGHPFVPGWEFIFKNTLVGLSDYWPGGLGAPAVADGGPRTLLGSIYAIVDHSFQTLWRLLLGFALGAGIGTLVALLVSASKWARRILSLPTQIIRPFPLLAIIPIFQLWFGTETIGAITFIALVVGIIFFTGVLNAVGNVPVIYVQNSRVLGAGPVRTYLSIVVPAIFPELQSTIMLAIGTAWTAALGAEFIGAENGLGKILTVAKYFSYVDRMFLVGIIVIVLATLSFLVAQKLSKPMIAWMPDR
jgi:NitT/TauT family transport system permease protein